MERVVGGPGAQLSKRTSTFVSSLRNGLTGPQLAASLNGTHKMPVSTSTVKRRLWDAGLLGRVAKKKPYLRLRLRWAKEHRHWTEEDWKKVLWIDESKFEVFGSHKRTITANGELFDESSLKDKIIISKKKKNVLTSSIS